MHKSKVKIIFFGSSSYTLPIAEALQKHFDLVLVITTEKSPAEPIISYCKANKIDYLSLSSFSDLFLKSCLLNLKSQLAVVADFGLIIPKEILDLFPNGTINIHPSLLPRYRGPSPAQFAILNGDDKTGVSIMKLDEKMDHGPILAQVEEPVKNTDTSQSLYQRLFKIGADLLPETIQKYINNKLELKEQNHSEATFTKMLTRQNGYVDISKIKSQTSKLEISQMIRAFYPWPGVWIEPEIRGKKMRIKLLPEEKIQVEGKKPMFYKDFLNGYPEAKEILSKIILV